VVALYGHAGGVVELFTRLGDATKATKGSAPQVEALHTHPLTEARLAAVHLRARQAGWAVTGAGTALPGVLVVKGR
jgi:predicted Zn-dependent protease